MEFGNAGNMIRIVATLPLSSTRPANLAEDGGMLINSRSDLLTFQCNGIVFAAAYSAFRKKIWTKLRDWAVRQAGASCYSHAALSSNDSKTL